MTPNFIATNMIFRFFNALITGTQTGAAILQKANKNYFYFLPQSPKNAFMCRVLFEHFKWYCGITNLVRKFNTLIVINTRLQQDWMNQLSYFNYFVLFK